MPIHLQMVPVSLHRDGYYSRKFAMETDGGMVGINVGIPVPTAYFPFSGNKDSFFGDLHVLGKDGYRFFTRAKNSYNTLVR